MKDALVKFQKLEKVEEGTQETYAEAFHEELAIQDEGRDPGVSDAVWSELHPWCCTFCARTGGSAASNQTTPTMGARAILLVVSAATTTNLAADSSDGLGPAAFQVRS